VRGVISGDRARLFSRSVRFAVVDQLAWKGWRQSCDRTVSYLLQTAPAQCGFLPVLVFAVPAGVVWARFGVLVQVWGRLLFRTAISARRDQARQLMYARSRSCVVDHGSPCGPFR